MMKDVFITRTGCFLPNSPVENFQIEDFLGIVYEKDSHAKRLVLKRNGIKQRYYALTKDGKLTHTNAELGANAVLQICSEDFSVDDIDLLACATSIPDLMFPSHASMIHGLLGAKAIELFSQSGVCLSSLQALKVAYLSVANGDKDNAVCVTSELASPIFLASNFKLEHDVSNQVGKNVYMAFEKEFLRFMLSDGASAALIQDKVIDKNIAYKIEWVDMISYANELPVCMLAGGEKQDDQNILGWRMFSPLERAERSIFCLKQDVRLLEKYAIEYFARSVDYFLQKNNVQTVDYVLPHISSMLFYDRLKNALLQRNINIGQKGWYTNLSTVGNIGSAAILAILDGFTKEVNVQKGDKILLLVPESGRFSYGAVLLTVF